MEQVDEKNRSLRNGVPDALKSSVFHILSRINVLRLLSRNENHRA